MVEKLAAKRGTLNTDLRPARACPGHPRRAASEPYQEMAHRSPTWMAGTNPAMTAADEGAYWIPAFAGMAGGR